MLSIVLRAFHPIRTKSAGKLIGFLASGPSRMRKNADEYRLFIKYKNFLKPRRKGNHFLESAFDSSLFFPFRNPFISLTYISQEILDIYLVVIPLDVTAIKMCES